VSQGCVEKQQKKINSKLSEDQTISFVDTINNSSVAAFVRGNNSSVATFVQQPL
jgi:hypothetical protein